jgi:hypothetical protein
MRTSTVERLVWIFIYGGLLVLCLGLFTQRRAFALGLGLILAGSVLAFVGAMLIFARSRMKE